MKVVILAGGLGSRITEESEYRPKAMIEIGGMPIIRHIMKSYFHQGFDDFVICAGYKQGLIKQWFADYTLLTSDVTFDFRELYRTVIRRRHTEPWQVTIVDTGIATMTGGRLKRVKDYVGNESFMLTYCDGVSNINVSDLLEFHRSHGKLATITAVKQPQQKGVLVVNPNGAISSFREKSEEDQTIINAGFMVLEPSVFDYIDGDDTVFERGPLRRLAAEGQLMAYPHHGFWQCMDTLREKIVLEELWASGNAPWKTWGD